MLTQILQATMAYAASFRTIFNTASRPQFDSPGASTTPSAPSNYLAFSQDECLVLYRIYDYEFCFFPFIFTYHSTARSECSPDDNAHPENASDDQSSHSFKSSH